MNLQFTCRYHHVGLVADSSAEATRPNGRRKRRPNRRFWLRLRRRTVDGNGDTPEPLPRSHAMNFEAAKAAHELKEARVAAGIPEELAYNASVASSHVLEAADRLRSQVKELQGRVDSIVSALDNGRSINSLGEIQGAGSTTDAACGRYYEAVRAAEFAEKLVADYIERHALPVCPDCGLYFTQHGEHADNCNFGDR